MCMLVYHTNLGPVVGQFILFDIMIPIIKPKRPRADAKICTINIETKVLGVCACARAVPVPMIPTERPQTRFEVPTTNPRAKTLNPEYSACWKARASPSVFE